MANLRKFEYNLCVNTIRAGCTVGENRLIAEKQPTFEADMTALAEAKVLKDSKLNKTIARLREIDEQQAALKTEESRLATQAQEALGGGGYNWQTSLKKRIEQNLPTVMASNPVGREVLRIRGVAANAPTTIIMARAKDVMDLVATALKGIGVELNDLPPITSNDVPD